MGILSKVCKPLSLLVALLAITIGMVRILKPEAFFSFNGGFILWAMTGGNMPPYFNSAAWESSEMRTWIKDDDLVVATGVKSGTTWMLFCTHQIRTKGSGSVDFRDVSISTPWPDLIQKPGYSWKHQKPLYNSTILHDGTSLKDYWDNPKFPFRIFKSHMTPKNIKIKDFPKVKFLAMTRNGLDVVDSLIPFFDQHTDEFRNMWGGFPPAGSGDTIKDAGDRLNELLPGGILSGLYFDYVNEWWPLRKEPNVMLLHYADARKDMKGTVTKLAKFLNVDLSLIQHAQVVKKCGMKYMKEHTDQFSYALPLNEDYAKRDARIMRNGSMTRNGNIGDGKVTFNDKQKATWAAAEEKMFVEPGLLKWAREGGLW